MATTHTVTQWAIVGAMICCGRLARVVTDYGAAVLVAVALHAQSC